MSPCFERWGRWTKPKIGKRQTQDRQKDSTIRKKICFVYLEFLSILSFVCRLRHLRAWRGELGVAPLNARHQLHSYPPVEPYRQIMDPGEPQTDPGFDDGCDLADSGDSRPRKLPADLPTSLNDRRRTESVFVETEVYDGWQGE